MTHEDTGDKMSVDHSVQIPGSSGVKSMKPKLDAGQTTMTVNKEKIDNPMTNKGYAPEYREINFLGKSIPSTGDREANAGKKQNPSKRGKLNQQNEK